jgi:hypothetical protein
MEALLPFGARLLARMGASFRRPKRQRKAAGLSIHVVFKPTGPDPGVRALVPKLIGRNGFHMDMPVMLRGDSPVRLFQGAIAGAALAMIIGFGWAGWTTGGNAVKMVDEASKTAVTAALAPICVEKFQHTANAQQNLADLKKTASYEQGTFVEKGGWAALPGSDASNYAVAQACATMLSNLK